jgi:biopolymer transport protein ExbB/TolQ
MILESMALGALTILVMGVAIISIIGLVKAVKVSVEIMQLKQRLTDDERELSREINMVESVLHNGIRSEHDRINNRIDEAHRHADQVQQYVDHRVDKLEAKLTGTLKSSKEVLKG